MLYSLFLLMLLVLFVAFVWVSTRETNTHDGYGEDHHPTPKGKLRSSH